MEKRSTRQREHRGILPLTVVQEGFWFCLCLLCFCIKDIHLHSCSLWTAEHVLNHVPGMQENSSIDTITVRLGPQRDCRFLADKGCVCLSDWLGISDHWPWYQIVSATCSRRCQGHYFDNGLASRWFGRTSVHLYHGMT